MTFSTWLLFFATELALCLTPGPAVLFVFAHGLRYGGRHSLWANIGILSANALYFALSATGLGMLINTSHAAFAVVKYAGAAYLVYLGVRMYLGTSDPRYLGAGDEASEVPRYRGSEALRTLRRAFVLQMSNPKALIFFTALLPQFVTPDASIPMQMLILGVTSTVAEFFVLLGYGYFAARIALWSRDARASRLLNRTAGSLLVLCGVSLALTSQE
jgi:homoserine/homoserine lactone efflux protein